MAPQEIIISGCSSEATSSTNPGRAYVPSIQVHDLLSNSTVHAFKTSVSTAHCLSHVGSQNGMGGAIFAVQEGKAIVNVWAWQKVCTCAADVVPVGRELIGAGPNALEAASARKAFLFQCISERVLGSRWLTQWTGLPLGGELQDFSDS